MENTLIKNWNSVVGVDDIVYNLGDVCFMGEKHKDFYTYLNQRLNGRHVLILGNHDIMKPWKYIECGFESVHTSLIIDNIILVHDPNNKYLLDLAQKENKAMFCGHVHGNFLKLTEPIDILNVGCDCNAWKYAPVEWNIALQYLKYAMPTEGASLESFKVQREVGITAGRVDRNKPAVTNGDFCNKNCLHLSMSDRTKTFYCIKYHGQLIPDQTHTYNAANPLRIGKCLKKEK